MGGHSPYEKGRPSCLKRSPLNIGVEVKMGRRQAGAVKTRPEAVQGEGMTTASTLRWQVRMSLECPRKQKSQCG